MGEFDDVRKAVAIRHNILIEPDDPVLVAVTINEVMLHQYLDMVAAQNAEYVKSVEAAIQKGIADSKVTAGRVITEGGDYVAQRVRATVVEVLKEIEEKSKSTPEVEVEEKLSWKHVILYGICFGFLLGVIGVILYWLNSMVKI